MRKKSLVLSMLVISMFLANVAIAGEQCGSHADKEAMNQVFHIVPFSKFPS